MGYIPMSTAIYRNSANTADITATGTATYSALTTNGCFIVSSRPFVVSIADGARRHTKKRSGKVRDGQNFEAGR